jgi:hypothetical protein
LFAFVFTYINRSKLDKYTRVYCTGFVSHLGNISKDIGIECKVVLGDVQVPLKQNISYKSTRVI